MKPPATIAVLGLGEAGSLIAADLVQAGAEVRGFDPVVRPGPGIVAAASDADACRGASVVLSLTCAHEAEAALAAALPAVEQSALYADLNTSGPALKARLARKAAAAGVAFADVALMSPVPGNGLRTPMLASGPAADRFAGIVGTLGATVQVLPGPPGAAATRKLVRSVFYKGMAAAVIEAVRAARAAGCEDWLRGNIAQELAGASSETINRLEQGSIRHARRRAEEMTAAAELLSDLRIPPRVATASAQWLAQLQAEKGARPPQSDN